MAILKSKRRGGCRWRLPEQSGTEPTGEMIEFIELLAAGRPYQWYGIEPMGKPTMTVRDKRIPRPVVTRYFQFRDRCRLQGLALPDAHGAIIFFLPVPRSWPKNKRNAAIIRGHREKPDCDNLLKAIGDAARKEDKEIWNLPPYKVYGRVPGFAVIWPRESDIHDYDIKVENIRARYGFEQTGKEK